MEVVKDLNSLTDELTIVDFFATWCGPCKMVAPLLEELHNNKQVKVLKVDVDQAEELANQFQIYAVPTLYLMKGKKVVDHREGYQSFEQLTDWINQYK